MTGTEPGGAGSTQTLPTLTEEPPASPAALAGRHRASGGGGRERRFWSGRRVPAALTAAVLVGASGLLLFDIASVRAGRPGEQWRKSLADQLAARSLDSAWIIAAAAVAAVLGLWLVCLAVTPGLRAVLPMRPVGTPGVRSGLDRRAAELVLRDSALQVAGVAGARVGVTRRTVKARVDVHFRELDDVREELDGVFADSMEQLGLSRSLRLSLDARRAGRR